MSLEDHCMMSAFSSMYNSLTNFFFHFQMRCGFKGFLTFTYAHISYFKACRRNSLVSNTQYDRINVHLKNNVLENNKITCAAPDSLLSHVYGHFTDSKVFLLY